jgi:leucyl aminopeptidase
MSSDPIRPGSPTVGIAPIRAPDWPEVLAGLDGPARAAAALAKFAGEAGQIAMIADEAGAVGRVLFGLGAGEAADAMAWRALAGKLPPGSYQIETIPENADATQIALALRLGAYRFERYRAAAEAAPTLAPIPGADAAEAEAIAGACALARDMVNTPANDMGPAEIEAVARALARTHGAAISVITGSDLLGEGYPAVHAVGRAAVEARAPRMIEITWGDADRPHLVLVGKGVVFDSGGLNLKPTAGIRWMKKDMGGAAHALALGAMIMAAKLPVRLTILTPIVENAIAGDAMRPGDILATRKGLTIEVGNTDAEGRLILADALARAAELEPDLTVDMATLTGAARVALGPEVVPFYTDDEALAAELAAASAKVRDPLWRMPLWAPYEASLESDIADLCNDPEPWAQAGSVTAALFLRRFAPKGAWAHFDIFAWNPRGRPGWPKGAEAQAIRALYAVIKARYA